MLRIIGGILAGAAAVFVITFVLETIAHLLFPMRHDGGPMPVGLQISVVIAWLAAAAVGGTVAGRIIGKRWAVWAIAILCLVLAVATILMLPHPVWMQIASVAAPIVGGLIAGRLAGTTQGREGDEGTGADAAL